MDGYTMAAMSRTEDCLIRLAALRVHTIAFARSRSAIAKIANNCPSFNKSLGRYQMIGSCLVSECWEPICIQNRERSSPHPALGIGDGRSVLIVENITTSMLISPLQQPKSRSAPDFSL